MKINLLFSSQSKVNKSKTNIEKQKMVPLSFNMTLGLIPIILCMILSEFFSYALSLYLCSALGVAYALFFYFLSGLKFRNYILFSSTVLLCLCSFLNFFSSGLLIPPHTLPVILEIGMVLFSALLFYGQQRVKRIYQKKKDVCLNDLVMHGLNSAIVASRLIFFMGFIHLILVLLFLLFGYPLGNTQNLFLFHFLPPLLLSLSILFMQIGINFTNKLMRELEEVPVVNVQGDVIGKRFKLEILNYKNKLMNPVIRIAFVYQGMLYLRARNEKNLYQGGKMDLTLECYIRFNEELEDTLERLLLQLSPCKFSIKPRFSVKYHYQDEDTNRLVYLYLAYIDEELIFSCDRISGGKLWTFQQIEQNLNKNYFCSCFEKEYDLLRSAVEIWEEYK